MKRLYPFIIKIFTPIALWWGGLHFPWTRKKITGEFYYKWRDSIKPGDVLLTTTFGEFSNLINPSPLKHGALYLGGNIIKYVGESVGKGTVKTDLVTFLTTKDIVVVVRKRNINDLEIESVVKKGWELIKKPLKYGFRKTKDDIYCYEYVIEAFCSVFRNTSFKMEEFLPGKYIYDSETFLNDPWNWEIIIDSRKNI